MSSPSPSWGGNSGPQASNQSWSPTPDPGQSPAFAPAPTYAPPAPPPPPAAYARVAAQQGARMRQRTWRDGMAVTALMGGIVALGLGWIGTGIFGVIAGIFAVVFGILGIPSRRRARSITGLVMGAVAIVGYAAFFFVIVSVLASRMNS